MRRILSRERVDVLSCPNCGEETYEIHGKDHCVWCGEIDEDVLEVRQQQ